MAERLEREFYLRGAVTIARGLLGQRLVRVLDGQRLAGLIVETEAYLGRRMRRRTPSAGGTRTAMPPCGVPAATRTSTSHTACTIA